MKEEHDQVRVRGPGRRHQRPVEEGRVTAVDAVIKSIEDALRSGEDVSFTGFGKFHVAERGAREGRNPRTGETMQIAASRVPRFTAGSGLKKAIAS